MITSLMNLIKFEKCNKEAKLIKINTNNLVIIGPKDPVNNEDRGYRRVCKVRQKAIAVSLIKDEQER